MTTTNSLNLNSNGVVTYNNTTGVFIGSALTQHDILLGGAGNAINSLAPSATSGIPLVSQGAGADPAYTTAVVAGGGTGATTLTGVLTGNGTSPFTASAVTQHDVLVGGATNTITSISPSTAGFVLTSNGTGADPTFQAASTGVAWVNVTAATQLISPSTGYVTDFATQVTYTLPAVGTFGDVFRIVGGVNGAASAPWTLAQNALQQIVFGNKSTTIGIGGSITSTLQYDGIEAVCIVGGASTVWQIIDSVGNFSVV